MEEEAEGVLAPLRTKRPRAVVVGPTRELTDQILGVAKSLSHHAKFSSMVLNAGVRMKAARVNLALHQDLLVATPTKFLEHHQAGNVYIRDVHMLVLDEADTMFDEKFLPETRRIITMLQKKKGSCQFILVAATVTKRVRAIMKEAFPDLHIVQTSTLHKSVDGSSHDFVILKPGQDKIQLLRDVLTPILKKSARVMVFCNTVSSCRCIEHVLQENGVTTICYHGEVPKNERKDIIDQFSSFENEGQVLVCTDVAARGLDIPGSVDHIINFDFPVTPVDYLHRSGRTARAGAPGSVTSLVGGKDRVLADRIKWAIERQLPLDELTSIKSVLPPSLRPKPSNSKKTKTSSLKGLRGAKRKEALQKIAKENAEEQRLLKIKKTLRRFRLKTRRTKPRHS